MSNSDQQATDAMELALGLSEMLPGEIPLGVFNQIARLTVVPVVEIVPIYKAGQVMQVMLHRREDDDALWPGKYYVPGTILNAKDEPGSYRDAFSRILDGKLGGLETSQPTFVGSVLCRVTRGLELALVHRVDLATKPEETALFLPDQLPTNMIEGHADFVRMAITGPSEADIR